MGINNSKDYINNVKEAYTKVKNDSNRFCLQKFNFSCCTPDPDEHEIQIEIEKRINREMEKDKKEILNSSRLFPGRLIRDDEKKEMIYTKAGVIYFIKKIENDESFIEDFKQEGLKIYFGNVFEALGPNIKTVKIELEIKKSELLDNSLTPEDLGKVILEPDKRKKWDINFDKFEVKNNLTENSDLIHCVTSSNLSPAIEWKEFYDKRAWFYEDDVFYELTSSVPEEAFPLKEEYRDNRVINYFGIIKIWDDDDKFNFIFINKIDGKENFPEKYFSMTLPNKIREFSKNYINYLNERLNPQENNKGQYNKSQNSDITTKFSKP